MQRLLNTFLSLSLIVVAIPAVATPEQNKESFQKFYMDRFSHIEKDDFANGVYALDQDARDQWEAMSDFPPFEDDLDEGEALFNTPFANGKQYADCFENKGQGVRQNYPQFDSKSGQVITLELAINNCRTQHGEKALPYKKGDLAKVSAYMASTSKGERFDIKIPNDKRAQQAYEAGKKYYYSKRGQLNFSCANCHVQNVGRKARSETLSASLGHPTHFPVYRMKWESFGTLQRRFDSCNKQVRAQPLEGQAKDYRNLEYFLTYMSNGLPVNGPASRK
ncbi:MAG: sulfur oxidation c-type cytochrome SoxA [Cycloclasticus sp. symbiont of Poecilosclerida sp. M]|nr:MAG: sulfur oxidation c-type cytochrome SoxA [Cycloclasticus sp. symbiont of Poecilosclerida sp. M]